MLVQIALTLTVLLGFCGLALDVGMLQFKKLQLQNAADAAALGAIYALQSGDSATAAARAEAALNGFTDGNQGVSIPAPENPPTTGAYTGNASAVRATVSQTVGSIFFSGSRTITAQATALASQAPCAFFLSQADTSTDSIFAQNESFSSNGVKCSIYLGRSYYFQPDSKSMDYQLLISSSSTASSSGSVSPPAMSTAPQSDPLGYVVPPQLPPSSSCASTTVYNYSKDSNTPTEIHPGLYCGGLQILCSGYTQVTLDPGIYYIAGDFRVGNPADKSCTGGTRLSGSGVTIYMTQLPGYPYGQANLNNYIITLSAPTSDPMRDIVFMIDRNLPGGKSTLTLEAANAQSTIDGIVYLPGQQLYMPSGLLQGKQYLGVVADNLHIHGSNLYLSAGYPNGVNPFHVLGGGLVE